MGNTDSKLNFRKAVVQLTTKTQPVEAGDESFWNQFWSESVTCTQDVFTLIPAAEIRALREENPSNLATLCYKAVEQLVTAGEKGCRSQKEHQTVLNCVRLLTRILPYIFEDPDWRGFFWSTLPGQAVDEAIENESPPLAQSLVSALADLLFCPEFTVAPNRKTGPDNPEDMQTIDSCEYIWEAGVGFASSPPANLQYDQNRCDILKLMLTCFSETMYLPPVADAHIQPNQWIAYFTSTENRHALPLFTSLLNIVCAYDPVGYGLPYNHLMFSDSREPLVEVALQVLCVTLDNEPNSSSGPVAASVDGTAAGSTAMESTPDVSTSDNLFVNYLSRIHREEDFFFVLKGITRLLNNPLMQTYLPGSCKKIQFHQELLVLFWKMCDINKKFMFYVLKSSDVLDILVPILYFLNDARADQSRVGLMHIGVFILLLLSGERNFGVRLNKPYSVRVPMDIPVFTGTHADFLIIVFHKIITTGHQRLQPLFDCLLTIIVNVSPYLKTLSMVASTKLLHLLEAFSTPWFLYASPTNHHLVFFLLEVFNNIIQYQFDGNANLVYTIIRKRNVFHQLANLPTEHSAIAKALTKRGRRLVQGGGDHGEQPSMEGSIPATEAEPGTLKVTLMATPVISTKAEAMLESPSWGLEPQQTVGAYSSTANPEEKTDGPLTNTNRMLTSALFDGNTPSELTTASSLDRLEGHSLWHTYIDEMHSRHTANSDVLSRSLHSLPKLDPCWRWINTHPHPIPHSQVYTRDHHTIHDHKHTGPDSDDDTLTTCQCSSCSVSKKETLFEQAQQAPLGISDSLVKEQLAELLGIEKMTEKSPASTVHIEQAPASPLASPMGASSVQPGQSPAASPVTADAPTTSRHADSGPEGQSEGESQEDEHRPPLSKAASLPTPPSSPAEAGPPAGIPGPQRMLRKGFSFSSSTLGWIPNSDWVQSWKQKLPLQTIMRLLQVLVPQVEKICIDKGLTDESEILKFLQHGTLVGLLPVPHPILIRKYQANSGTTMWFRTYMWGVIYLRNVDPPVWYDTDVKLFEIQRV